MLKKNIISNRMLPSAFRHDYQELTEITDIPDEFLQAQDYAEKIINHSIKHLTLTELLDNVVSYKWPLDPYANRSAVDQIETDCLNDVLYAIITPIILYKMTCGRQIAYHNCYNVDVQNNIISVIIDSTKLDEMNVLCDFFGYELHSQRSLKDEVYAAGRPTLIEATYKLVEIPGIETKEQP